MLTLSPFHSRAASTAVATAGGGRTETIADRARWSDRLADLSRRNAGRPVTLEADEAPLGAHAQASHYSFRGIEYDGRGDRIMIRIGNPAGGRSQLTHSLAGPTAVEVLEGTSDKTLALRVETELGQTLLSFLT
jgi:hypothetical protein